MPERNPDGTFAVGNSGSPGRKRKRYRIEHILEKIGMEEVKAGGITMTKLDAVMRSVYQYALKGNSWAVQFIAERTEGKVPNAQVIEHTVSEPIKIFDFNDPANSAD